MHREGSSGQNPNDSQPSETRQDGPPPLPGESTNTPRSDPSAEDLFQPAGLPARPEDSEESSQLRLLRGRPIPLVPAETPPMGPKRVLDQTPLSLPSADATRSGSNPLVVAGLGRSFALTVEQEAKTTKALQNALSLARQAEAEGRFQDSVLILESVVESSPQPDILRWLGRIYIQRLGFVERGHSKLREADQLERGDEARAWHRIATNTLRAGRLRLGRLLLSGAVALVLIFLPS